VGSTAVPGLDAKPIIDIDVVVPDARAVVPAITALAAAGWRHEGDLGVAGREALFPPAGLGYHHLYLVVAGSRAHRDHVDLRDFLRAHPAEAARYGRLKRRLSALLPTDRAAYTGGKAEMIAGLLRRARAAGHRDPVHPQVRRCEEADLPALEASMPGSHRKFFERQSAGAAEYLVAWVSGAPVGHFALDWQGQDLPGVPEINTGEVRGDMRSRGIGTALIAECEKLASRRRARRVCLLVADDNPRARRRYERLGYRDTGATEVVAEYDDTNAAGETRHFREECAVLVKELARS
jgi:ribosomal protein S18 acetylase RimI-like enzyme